MATSPSYGFVEPDTSLDSQPFAALHGLLDIAIFSGHRADFSPYTLTDSGLREIVSKMVIDADYEDQCSVKYYVDMHKVVMEEAESIDRIVEVGVYMGGASVMLAGCAEKIDAELVLIDINDRHLQFAFQRLVRCFPSVRDRVRLFHGDLPTYVRDVLLPEDSAKNLMIQLDGSHIFQEVIRDLGTLYYVRDRLVGVMAQDTHLRGPPLGARFIDAALYGVFGGDLQYMAIGAEYTEDQTELTTPNQYGGNYFLAGKPEGMYVPMRLNAFTYPHPLIKIDDFFW